MWQVFFRLQRSPVLRSEMLTALMSGTQLLAERIPNALLLDVALLATASRRYLEAEIVDDYAALLRRVEEKWAAPDWTARVFDSIHANYVSGLLKGWAMDMEQLDEVTYVPKMTQWYLEHDVPGYFVKEL